MEHLNGGFVDVAAARLRYDTVEGSEHEAWYEGLEGGPELYGPALHRRPFVHGDVPRLAGALGKSDRRRGRMRRGGRVPGGSF